VKNSLLVKKKSLVRFVLSKYRNIRLFLGMLVVEKMDNVTKAFVVTLCDDLLENTSTLLLGFKTNPQYIGKFILPPSPLVPRLKIKNMMMM